MMSRGTRLRDEGRLTRALLLFLKQVTAHGRWVLGGLLLLYGASGIHTIQPRETALVRRLGRLENRLHGPGLLVCLPPPFDEVLRFESGKELGLDLEEWSPAGEKIDDPDKPVEISDAEMNRRMDEEGSGGSVFTEYREVAGKTLDPVRHGYTLTSDVNVIQGRFTLRYRIADPFRFLAAGDDVGSLLERLARRALTAELAERRIDESLTGARDEIAKGAAESVRAESERLSLGVAVTGIDIRALTPPAQVLRAFEDVTSARTFARTMLENSRQYRGEILAKSTGEAAAISHRAEGYATGLLEEARGEAGAFLALLENYRLDPELVARRLLRESLDTVMRQMQSRALVPADRTLPTMILEPQAEMSR